MAVETQLKHCFFYPFFVIIAFFTNEKASRFLRFQTIIKLLIQLKKLHTSSVLAAYFI